MKGTPIVIAALSIIALLGIGRFIWSITVAPAVDVAHKTMEADNIIYNYEYFKKQYRDIKSLKSKVRMAEQAVIDFKKDAGPRKEWSFEDKTEAARLASVKTGMEYQLRDAIADYNAKSAMANRNIFKHGDELPERISAEDM